MSLRSFLLKRVIYTIVLIVFVVLLNWVIFRAMPGAVGNQYAVLGQSGKVGKDQLNYINNLYGLDKDYWTQFVDYIKAMLTFQFGVSYHDNQFITTDMITTHRLENTLELLGTSTVMAIIIGILLGILISKRRGSTLDNFWVTASLTTYSLPTFFMGIILIFVFATFTNWFPPG